MSLAFLKIKVSPEKHKDALDTIRATLGWTCAQPGCISMAFYQNTNDSDSMVLLEEWEDWTGLERYIRSNSYRNILELMELSTEQPEIKFSKISGTKGMEFVEKLRG